MSTNIKDIKNTQLREVLEKIDAEKNSNTDYDTYYNSISKIMSILIELFNPELSLTAIHETIRSKLYYNNGKSRGIKKIKLEELDLLYNILLESAIYYSIVEEKVIVTNRKYGEGHSEYLIRMLEESPEYLEKLITSATKNKENIN